MDHICYFCLVFVMFSCTLIDALWSPAVRGRTSSGVRFEVVAFPLVSWVRCVVRLRRVLIVALFLTFITYADILLSK